MGRSFVGDRRSEDTMFTRESTAIELIDATVITALCGDLIFLTAVLGGTVGTILNAVVSSVFANSSA
ncbi:hypothetical protein L484_004269 [Morus notabilis]|uniref:Uncharacterized protein n=1 Tax=Morus notabilis TaxID=981085 RepID=W9QWW2_9ROSA|nr:hypothetical protein L484_004269 [Morus notabilis]